MTPAPSAPVGSVTDLPSYAASDFRPTDAILCRNTAPLVTFAFSLLRRSVACHIHGRDIAASLTRLCDRTRGATLAEFRINLIRDAEGEASRLHKKGKRQAAAAVVDKAAALSAIAASCTDLADLKPKLDRLFRDGPGVTLSTIHRAKGLEWDRVFLLDWHLLPSPYAEASWEKQQERNLQYVATTRARLDLVFINSNNWK